MNFFHFLWIFVGVLFVFGCLLYLYGRTLPK